MKRIASSVVCLYILVAGCISIAMAEEPLIDASVFKQKVNAAIRSLRIEGTPVIETLPPSSTGRGPVLFTPSGNWIMEVEYLPGSKGSLSNIELFTRNVGGETHGEPELLFISYGVIKALIPRMTSLEVQKLLEELKINNTTGSLQSQKTKIIKRVQGIEFVRLPQAGDRRGTLRIRKGT